MRIVKHQICFMLWPGVSWSFLPSEGEPADLSCHRKENSSEGEWQITWWVKKCQRFCQAWASVRKDESRAVGRPFRQSCEARELIGLHPEWWQWQWQWLFSVYWTIQFYFLHNNLPRWGGKRILSLFWFFRWRHWGTERWGNLPKVTQ